MTTYPSTELFCDYLFAETQREMVLAAASILPLSRDSPGIRRLDDVQACDSGVITRMALRAKAERGTLSVPSLELKPLRGIEVDLGIP